MTTFELNQIIKELIRPEFDHVSKTYLRGEFINVAYKHIRQTINLETANSDAQRIIQSLRK